VNFRRVGPYRFFFTTNDLDEPPHIHVERDGLVAKFWLSPIRLSKSSRFASHELSRMERIVRDQHSDIMEAWNEFLRRRN
jgi:hypothetical protein